MPKNTLQKAFSVSKSNETLTLWYTLRGKLLMTSQVTNESKNMALNPN